MLTETPAKIAGIANKYGVLRVGAIGDLTIFDENINVFATTVDGKIHYN